MEQLREAASELGYGADSEVGKTFADVVQELQAERPDRRLVAEMLTRVVDQIRGQPSLSPALLSPPWLPTGRATCWVLGGSEGAEVPLLAIGRETPTGLLVVPAALPGQYLRRRVPQRDILDDPIAGLGGSRICFMAHRGGQLTPPASPCDTASRTKETYGSGSARAATRAGDTPAAYIPGNAHGIQVRPAALGEAAKVEVMPHVLRHTVRRVHGEAFATRLLQETKADLLQTCCVPPPERALDRG